MYLAFYVCLYTIIPAHICACVLLHPYIIMYIVNQRDILILSNLRYKMHLSRQ